MEALVNANERIIEMVGNILLNLCPIIYIMLTRSNNIAKVGTHPIDSQNIGAIPFETLLEVVDWTDIAHLRRNPQKGLILP